MISVERMLNEVWPGLIVGPASVYQAISQLRRLLGDTDPEPTYIATIPRKGYQLVAPVQALPGLAPTPDPTPGPMQAEHDPAFASLRWRSDLQGLIERIDQQNLQMQSRVGSPGT